MHALAIALLMLPLFYQPVCAAETKSSERSSTVDWSPYMKALQLQVRKHWSPPMTHTTQNISAQWLIHEDGTVSGVKITKHGTTAEDDKAALTGIKESSPFAPLPKGTGKVEIRFEFNCNFVPQRLGLTVAKAIERYGPDAKKRILPYFQKAQVDYPPKGTAWVCLKEEKLLLIFARDKSGNWKQVLSYPIVGTSGVSGPKLKEGDLQIPEGFYKIATMDAMKHLALWVNYPNRADQANAKAAHRTNLGGAIQIHGGSYSTGCLPMGNDGIEELFLLAHDSGFQNIDLVMAPCNLLVKKTDVDFGKQPKWLPKLYINLKQALKTYPIAAPAPSPAPNPAPSPRQTPPSMTHQ
jgi:hypothetical protein